MIQHPIKAELYELYSPDVHFKKAMPEAGDISASRKNAKDIMSCNHDRNRLFALVEHELGGENNIFLDFF